ncbi:MAG: succinate dehydrogenase assembly factor 2 [Woeseiaceae bacterium]
MISGKLRWQCRRGMRELDELLERYLQSGYERAPESEKRAFCELLKLSNPELIGYLLGHEQHPDPDIADAIDKIRSRTRS